MHRRHQRTRICAQCRAGAAFSGRPSSRSDARSGAKDAEIFRDAAVGTGGPRARSNPRARQCITAAGDGNDQRTGCRYSGRGRAGWDRLHNVAMVRGRRHLGDQTIFTHQVEPAHAWIEIMAETEHGAEKDATMRCFETAVLNAFIAQHYLTHPVPAALVAGQARVEAGALEYLQQRAGRRVRLIRRPKGQPRAWQAMAEQNAQLALARRLSERGLQQARTRAVAQLFNIKQDDPDALRIECFDISHTMGEAARG